MCYKHRQHMKNPLKNYSTHCFLLIFNNWHNNRFIHGTTRVMRTNKNKNASITQNTEQ